MNKGTDRHPRPSPAPSEALIALGRKAEAHGEPEAAARFYDEVLRRNERRVDLLNSLGTGLLRLKRHAQALSAFRRATEIEPASTEAWVNRALAHVWRAEHEDAHIAFERALSLQPSTPRVLNNLAFVAQMLGHIDTAVALLEKALSIAPDYGVARKHLGGLRAELGQSAAARTLLRQAIATPGLPHDLRESAQGTLIMLDEHDRLQPQLEQSVACENPRELHAAVAATPDSCLAADDECLALLSDLARSLSSGVKTGGFRPRAQTPQGWPLIEAHFALHRGDTLEDLGRSRAQLRHVTPSGPPAMLPREIEDLVRYEAAVRRRGQWMSPDLDGVGWECRIRYCHAFLTWHRPEFFPGHFKPTQNLVRANPIEKRAAPWRVAGTFRQFFETVYVLASPGPGRAALVYHAFAKIHGFVDGNGRLGRFLLNRELEAAGLGPIVIPDCLKEHMAAAIRSSRRSRDLRKTVEVLAEASRFTIRLLRAYSGLQDILPAS